MAVPTSAADRPAIRRGISRNNSRSLARRSISRAVANEIGIVVRNPSRIARRLNVCRAYRGVSRNFLFKIAHRDVERAASQQIRGGVVVARLGKLPVSRRSGEMRKGQGSNKHDKGENNDQRSAFSCAITRMKELFHGWGGFTWTDKLTFVQPEYRK